MGKQMHAKAVAPGHITGFFKIFGNGSTGAGINIEDGMATEVWAKASGKGNLGQKSKKGKIEVRINGKNSTAPVSRNVIGKFLALIAKNKNFGKKFWANKVQKSAKYQSTKFSIKVLHRTTFPIGYGLGISGAGAFSLSLALNRAFRLNLPYLKCREIAKQAEIECGTGLGDVIAESFNNGIMFGKKPYPSKAVNEIKSEIKNVALAFFAPIETKKIIRNREWKSKINAVGEFCMAEINNEPTLTKFIQLCRHFTMHTGLGSKKILETIAAVPNASMSMLGQTIFVPTDRPKEAEKMLKKFTKRVQIAKISNKGARVL